MDSTNNNRDKRFSLSCNGRTFAQYLIDTNGNLWDAATGETRPWQREAAADLSMGSKSRSETAGKRKISKLVSDDGALVTIGKAEAVAWSIPDVAAGRKPGTVVVFKDGDRSNETAANLMWGSPYEMLAKTRAGKSGGSNSNQLLSIEDVKEILSNYNPHDLCNNSRAFADKFGVAQTTINNVVSYKTFPHVSREPYAKNPHIKHRNYFDTYVPGEGTQMYNKYVEQGKIVLDKTTSDSNGTSIIDETIKAGNQNESEALFSDNPQN